MKVTVETDRKIGNGKPLTANGRFGAMAAVARRQFCAKFNVITPQEVQWKPPPRQAALTLYASGGDSALVRNEIGNFTLNK